MVICPYCNHGYEYCNDEGFEQDSTWEEKCPECGKLFLLSGWYEECFSECKMDCSNGEAEHDYQMTCTYPKEFARMECTVCGRIQQ